MWLTQVQFPASDMVSQHHQNAEPQGLLKCSAPPQKKGKVPPIGSVLFPFLPLKLALGHLHLANTAPKSLAKAL